MSDLISRQAAIDALLGITAMRNTIPLDSAIFNIKKLPSTQPEQHLDEWCVDCKEYDKEKHSCPRWNRVIRQTLLDAQPEHKTGRWIPDNTDYYRTRFICSVCGESEEVPTMGFGYAPMWGYCPNCGADMRGEQE